MAQSIRFRRKKKIHEEPWLDLTAMIDVVTILIFFLLMHYDAESVNFTVPKGVDLPTSKQRGAEVKGINVQVSPVSIFVKEKIIIEDYLNDKSVALYDEEKRVILPLFNELVKEREIVENASKAVGKVDEVFSGKVNLMVDKTVPYSFLKKVMFTAAEAGFKKYQFIIINNEM